MVNYLFDRRMRRRCLERKTKNIKRASSNVFLWLSTLTSGSLKRVCFCGVKNVKTNPGPGCSKQGQDNPGLVRNSNTDMKALKPNSVFFLPAMQ